MDFYATRAELIYVTSPALVSDATSLEGLALVVETSSTRFTGRRLLPGANLTKVRHVPSTNGLFGLGLER